MKEQLRALFSPILKGLESGTEEYHYKPMNRQILLFFSVAFGSLATLVVFSLPEDPQLGYYLPVLVFGSLSFVGFVVSLLGTDRAVAKIWGNK
jgi:VIT1/CCC1 family predicted Fe2+/Mn2+ transporter